MGNTNYVCGIFDPERPRIATPKHILDRRSVMAPSSLHPTDTVVCTRQRRRQCIAPHCPRECKPPRRGNRPLRSILSRTSSWRRIDRRLHNRLRLSRSTAARESTGKCTGVKRGCLLRQRNNDQRDNRNLGDKVNQTPLSVRTLTTPRPIERELTRSASSSPAPPDPATGSPVAVSSGAPRTHGRRRPPWVTTSLHARAHVKLRGACGPSVLMAPAPLERTAARRARPARARRRHGPARGLGTVHPATRRRPLDRRQGSPDGSPAPLHSRGGRIPADSSAARIDLRVPR